MTTILVTGGAGFIGSHYVRYVLNNHPNIQVINVDALTYSGNLMNLRDIEDHPRYHFIEADLGVKEEVSSVFNKHQIAQVVHFAAESHVDRSIQGREPFIHSNIIGTFHLLEMALKKEVQKFVHISTDEVYGSIPYGRVDESGVLKPGNPYSASKASSDLLSLSYFNTYKFPVVITRCTNNYGPNQHPEKLIPHSISLLLKNKPINLYGDGKQERDWLYVLDHVRAVDEIRKQGKGGEVYHIGAEEPITNIEVAHLLLEYMNKSTSLVHYVKDRPGHDVRYSLDTSKTKQTLKWSPAVHFKEGLKRTVEWYLENEAWWQSYSNGENL